MSLRKLQTQYKNNLESLSKVSSPDLQLIIETLKLTNHYKKELKKNADWVKNRQEGKAQRRSVTDSIKAFIEYAKTNGSVGADRYYMNFTKMQNSALGSINRDTSDLFTLNAYQMSDAIITNVLKTGMEKGVFYKDIFKEAKKTVENFAKSVGLK